MYLLQVTGPAQAVIVNKDWNPLRVISESAHNSTLKRFSCGREDNISFFSFCISNIEYIKFPNMGRCHGSNLIIIVTIIKLSTRAF